MPTVFQLLPDATMLRELEPEELSGALMEHLNSLPANEKTSVHPGNLYDTSGGPASSYPRDVQEPVNEALREAFAWLVREGLLVPKRDGWYVISRHGRKMAKRADVDASATETRSAPQQSKQLEVETG